MSPVQHPYPGFFASDRGLGAFTGRLRNGHPYPILINAQDGSTYPVRARTSRCSSPTTPPGERRAYAAREQARKAKAQSSSERSTPLPPQGHTHSHRVHLKREPEHLPQAHKHSIKHHNHHHHHRKAPKPAEQPRRRDGDTESNWSTDAHAPQTPHYFHHHHHAIHPDQYTFKAPFNCHCHNCLQAALQPVTTGPPQPVEAPKEDPAKTKYFYEPRPPVDPRVPCPCAYVHVEPARERPSRSQSPDKHRKGQRRHSPEPEEVRSHRRRHRRYRRHRHHTTDSSSDTTTDDDDETSLESDEEARAEGEKVDYELPSDWHFCNECCCGHPVIYILR